ncbi:tetratricopeptide repeat protein [Desulfosarcina ovata]|uniref:Uncharacterized protein n=1 Tax=Desulfosarcina ovata subsp. ovata TaxID=2752305 RepID=A0A5K8AE68_9BACT|nr:tetratricopeptide repeat protein [Desulfosarcina ovata]BBO90836.1 hypothetical protein DSCOOX_40160 [Desulfosarcina ovata subsp. ovata]
MNRQALLPLVILLWGGLWACSVPVSMSTSARISAPGDQELKNGIYWYQKGCLRKAVDHLNAAHEMYCLADHPVGVARSLTSLGNVYRQAGDPENAGYFYDAAIAMARRCDDRQMVAQTLVNKVALLIDRDDRSAAEVLLEEARVLSQESGSVFAAVLNYQAVLMMKTQRNDQAALLLDQAESVATGNIRATLHYTRGRLLMQTGKASRARNFFEQALEMDRQAGFSRGMAADLFAMADSYESSGEYDAALSCLERSLKIYALLEDRQRVLAGLDHLEGLARTTGSDIRVTLHVINQWLAGEAVDAICR